MGRRPWPKRKGKLRYRVLLVLTAAMLFWGGSIWRDMEALIGVYGETRCRNLITQTVLDCLAEVKTADKLSSFTTTESVDVLQLNGEAAQTLQTQLGKTLASRLDALAEQTHLVPLGTVLENVFFIGQGPDIAIRYAPIGAAQVAIDSAISDAGVNQVLYQVFLTVSVDMTVLVPGGPRVIACSQQLLLEEALITGRVPLAYSE